MEPFAHVRFRDTPSQDRTALRFAQNLFGYTIPAMASRLLIWVFLLIGPAIAADLEIVGDVLPMAANASKASGSIRLKNTNKSKSPVTIRLRAGRWENSLAGANAGPVSVTFSETPAGKRLPEYRGKLSPGAAKELWVEVTWANAPGITKILLFNDEEQAGSVEVLRLDVPFAVKMDPAMSEILVADGENSSFRLVNEDSSSYRVSWKLELPSQTYSGHDEVVQPKSFTKVTIPIDAKHRPFGKWSWTLGLLKDDVQDGILTLTFQPRPSQDPKPSADPSTIAPQPSGARSHVLHASTKLRFYPNFGGVLNNATLILFLFLGAITSLVLKLWLPNTRRKLKLKEDLELLGRQIADVSGRVGARPTVILRVQQKRLLDLLNPKLAGGRWALSPDFEDVAKQCEASTVRLSKQVELIRSLDRSAARLAALMPKPLPPSLLDHIDSGIERIVSLAMPLEADDESLRALETDVAQIAMCVQQMEQFNTVFRQDVQRRLTDVMAFFNPLLQPPVTAQGAGQAGPSVAASHLQQIVQRIKVDLPAIFEVLNRVKPLPEDVSFDTLVQIDADVFKLGLIRRYVYLSPNLNHANPSVNSVPGMYFGKGAMFPGLKHYLDLRSWDALRTARNLIGQAEQALYKSDVEEAIRLGRVSIRPDRLVIRPYMPVEFSVRFDRESLNQASAREEYRCVWVIRPPSEGWRFIFWIRRWLGFPVHVVPTQTLGERSWTISQYFPSSGQYTMAVTFEDWMGVPLMDAQQVLIPPITRTFPVKGRAMDKTGPRLRLELVCMLLALAPAIFALLTTAQNQVSKVEWSTALGAVFALGFGVDVLKNLLTQK
jgi:hypothetical protein